MKIFLIKHGSPEKDPNIAPKYWKLSEKGKLHAKIVADKLKTRGIEVLYSSDEKKAIETAEIISKDINVNNSK